MTSRLGFIMMAAILAAAPAQSQAAPQLGPAPMMIVAAESYLDVIQMLEDTGYNVTGMKSTLLGRLKIRAQNKQHLREIVVSRSTGEIKSDRILKVFGGGEGGSSLARNSAGKTSDTGGDRTSTSTGGVSVSSGGTSVSVGSGGIGASVGGVSVGLGN